MMHYVAYQALRMSKDVRVLKAGVPDSGGVYYRGKFLFLV